MTTEEQIRARLDELCKRPNEGLSGGAGVIAWAGNVLTMVSSLRGPNDFQVKNLENIIADFSKHLRYGDLFIQKVLGILKAVKSDFEGGYLVDIRMQLRGEVEADFLSQAQRLIENKLKDPAAMLVGAVLEDALRQLCHKYGIPEGNNIESMNKSLRKVGAYGLPQQQQITAWAAIRNKADHARFNEYDLSQVTLMHQGVSDFIVKYLC